MSLLAYGILCVAVFFGAIEALNHNYNTHVQVTSMTDMCY